MWRIVLDTNVLASAFRSPDGASRAVLRKVREEAVRLLVTPPLFLEYEGVLKRPEQRLVTGLTLSEIDTALEGFAAILEPVEIHYRWRPQLPDPGDEMVLEAAINGRSDALVTFNSRHFAPVAARFALVVLRPAEFLDRIRQS